MDKVRRTKQIFRFFICVGWLTACFSPAVLYAQQTYSVKGRVTDKKSGEAIPFVSVKVVNTTYGALTDTAGYFIISTVPAGIHRLEASSVGFKTAFSLEFRLTAGNVTVNMEMESSDTELGEVEVTVSPFRRTKESPVSLTVIGMQEIERSPGANRDISRIVTSYPGVAAPVSAGYRNDLIVRGGGPFENRFYLDGIEIPNINHFSTQGASGGPVGILDADFISEVNFYSGAFPVNRANALSSVLDFRLRDGSLDKNTVKATLGASEVALGANGHIGDKTTYLVSVRRSYLQLLFRMLKMPFLPTFTDAQFKIKHRFSREHELTVLGLGAIDDMKLNDDTDAEDESKQYLLNYLPVIKQNTYTVGAVYRHTQGRNAQTFVVSRSFMNNKNTKFKDNDESSDDNLTLRYRSDEAETRFRAENRTQFESFRLNAGVNLDFATYDNRTFQRIFHPSQGAHTLQYATDLSMVKWGVFASGEYHKPETKYSLSAGIRVDANDYSSSMKNPFKQFSPRLSGSYELTDQWVLNASAGRFYQLPAYTTLGYRDLTGQLINRENGIRYMQSDQVVGGLEYRMGRMSRISWEGFYKWYSQMPLSVFDNIPLSSKGTDYGVTGNEEVTSNARGRAYGTEVMIRWIDYDRFNLVSSYTYVRSEFKSPQSDQYIPSAWDNRHLFTLSGVYLFRHNWNVGMKFRAMGGAPYTPYDLDRSSLVEAWDARLQPYYDYTQYNRYRLKAFTQLDIRVDKIFYFKGVMLGVYIDLQNVLNQKYRQPDLYVSTGQIDPSTAGLPHGQQRYVMKYIKQESGTILPTLGITVEF